MKRVRLKIALGFAVAGYLVTIGLYFAPPAWHLPPTLIAAICPPELLVMISMTDPSFGAIAFLIAPINAVLYGVLGLVVGLAIEGP